MKLDLGCGDRKREGYEGVDFSALEGVDHVCDLTKPLPFADSSVDAVSSSHFFEHLVDAEVFALSEEVWRILKPGGEFEVVVPNFPALLESFLTASWPLKWRWNIRTIFGNQHAPGEFHKTGFDMLKLTSMLEAAKFTILSEDEVWTHEQSSLRVVCRK